MAAALPLVFLLALALVGVLQARANTEEPALLRFKLWQLIVGLLGVLLLALRSKLSVAVPHVGTGGMTVKAALVVLALALALVLVLRKRRAAAV